MFQLPENKRREITSNRRKRVFIYGNSLAGKTTFADKFPDPVMLNSDGSTSNITAPIVPIVKKEFNDGRRIIELSPWEVFLKTIELLEKKQNTFKTVVVDLVEGMYEHCRSYIFKKHNFEHESDLGFGKGYSMVDKEFFDTMNRVLNLDYEYIILISRQKTEAVTKRNGENISTIKPDLRDKVMNEIVKSIDLIGRITCENNEKRILSFKNDDYVFGGVRIPINNAVIPADFEAFKNNFIIKNINKQGE